ncbi:MAG: hypothetical protein QM785_00030 [Pyrinomonadaceae bacterium]
MLIVVGSCSISIFAQAIPVTPNTDLRKQMESAARVEADIENRMAQMRQLENRMVALSKLDAMTLRKTPALDKGTRDRIMAMRRVASEDIAKNAAFLADERSGIFKLFSDHDCVSETLIRIDGICTDFVPESSSFSFRTGNYTDVYYHDIGYNNDEFYNNSFFSQGIFVSLGDVPIENVDLEHAAIKTLADQKPAVDAAEAKAASVRYKTGFEQNGFSVAQHVKPVPDTTYAVRTIAYRLDNSLPPVTDQSTMNELRFHSLGFDKRADQIVVFRVVRRAQSGTATIVWKELSRKDAPKIKFPKGAPLADFKL